jgi:DNA (cytosine-5)-methyltransferase 1
MIVSSLPLDWNIPSWAKESFIRKVIGEGIPSRMITVIVEQLLKQL